MLSAHIKTILWQKHGNNLSFLSCCLLYLFSWSMLLWVLVILMLKSVKTVEITEIVWRSDMDM